MTPYIIQQQCSWNTLPGNRAVTDSSAQRKMLTFRKMHSASKLIVSPLECKSLQTCYATPPASSPFIWLPLSSITCLLLHIPASDLCKPSAPPARSQTAANLTFTPRVEEHDDVLAGVVSSCWLALHGAARHRESVQAAYSGGWRVDGQLDRGAVLLDDLGLPAFILQLIHHWNDDMGAFGHHG